MNISQNIKFLFMVVILILLPLTALQSQLKIMPLGDSITQGVISTANKNFSPVQNEVDGTYDYQKNVALGFLAPGNGGYRFVLEQMLIDMDWDVEMVGQLTEGGGYHEGYPGYTTDEIIPILPDILEANPPDIILLHIGTNDVPTDNSPAVCFDNIEQMLDIIHDFDNEIKVILAQIIPCLQNNSYGQQRYPAIIELNNLIPQALDGRPYVTLVDMWTPFVEHENWETELMSGTWHPNESGYYLMAEIWRDALDFIVDGRSPLIFNSSPTEAYISESNLECTIDGGFFMNGVSIRLQRVSTAQQLSAFQVTYENENRVYATFDLNNGFVGQWRVIAVNPNNMRSINSPEVLFSILADSSVTSYYVRINTGGNAYTDVSANEWSADQEYTLGSYGYIGGNIYSTSDSIAGTDDDQLYQSERWGMSAYRFDMPDGDYSVVLHFAEIFLKQSGSRLMSVDIEGVTVLSDLDIYDEVGPDAALAYTFTDISVNDGRVDINFSSNVEAPKISAIEVSSVSDIPVLAVNPNLLDFGLTETELTFIVENIGQGTLDWTATENPEQSWITAISPPNGSLGAAQSQTVTIKGDRSGLAVNNYIGTVSVTSNGGSEDIIVSINVAEKPEVVTGLSITREGEMSVRLTWDESSNATSYNIYRGTTPFFSPVIPIENTSDLTYVDHNSIGDPNTNYYYVVTAVSAAGESDISNRIGEFDYELITTPTTNFNEIALPLVTGVSKASELMALIPNCTSIARWNASTQGYEQYVDWLPATDFDVIPGYPYYVDVNINSIFCLVGNYADPSFNLITTATTNFNEIMLPLDKEDITSASELLTDIANCTSIARWDALSQGYEQYVDWLPPTNFNVRVGYPYYVDITENSVWPSGSSKNRLVSPKAKEKILKSVYCGVPHLVYGKINLPSDIDPSEVHYRAFVSTRKNELVNNQSSGCKLLADGQFWLQCANFPSTWEQGDIVQIEFYKNKELLQTYCATLSYNSTDEATLLLDKAKKNAQKLELLLCYPNPFNAETLIKYEVSHDCYVRLVVYNSLGQKIRTLIDEKVLTGNYSIVWDSKTDSNENAASGMYFCWLMLNDKKRVQKMILVR